MGAADTDSTIRLVDDGFNYPEVNEMLMFTTQSNGGTSFTVRIENIAAADALVLPDSSNAPVLFAPGVFVVHSDGSPLFVSGQVDPSEGLEVKMVFRLHLVNFLA